MRQSRALERGPGEVGPCQIEPIRECAARNIDATQPGGVIPVEKVLSRGTRLSVNLPGSLAAPAAEPCVCVKRFMAEGTLHDEYLLLNNRTRH